MSRNLYPPTPSAPRTTAVATVDKGGTGGTSLATAATSLGAISQTAFGQANGVAQLGSDGFVPAGQLIAAVTSGPTLNGPASVVISQSGSYEITNYDSSTTYTASVSAGTVSVSGSTIQFNAPATLQTVTLTLNAKTYSIGIVSPKPDTPVISVALSGAISLAAATFTGTAFNENPAINTHASSDWQISTDSGFSSIAFQSLADATNKTSWTIGGLALSTTYYSRARYTDSVGSVSDWSTTLPFTTSASYSFGTEEAKLHPAGLTGSSFGGSCNISSDGTRVIVTASRATNGSFSQAGSAYIFRRSGTTWTQEAKLVPSDAAASDLFGVSSSMSADGSRVVIGAMGKADGSNTQAGAVYIFSRSSTTWTQEAKLLASDSSANHLFGYSVSISADGTRLAAVAGSSGAAVYVFLRTGTTWAQETKLQGGGIDVSRYCSMSTDGSRMSAGGAFNAAYVFLRTGTTWALEQTLTPTDAVGGDNSFGYNGYISGDSLRIVVGFQQKTVNGFAAAGAVYVFVRTGTVWAQEAKIVRDASAANDYFGISCSITSDGSKMIAGASGRKIGAVVGAGTFYTYVRTGSVWALDSKTSASDPTASAAFGTSCDISSDGTRAVVGSPGSSSNEAAYIYR